MDSNKEKTIGEIRALEENLMRLHTLEELEASPELLNELPEPERSMFLERRRALRDFVIENQQAMDALREELRETTDTYNRIIQQAAEKYGRPREEIEELLVNDPEVNSISFGDFVDRSSTEENKLQIDGLLDTIVKKSREENRSVNEIVQDIRNALERGETPSITIKRPRSVEYPIDKINSKVWNLLQEDTAGQITFSAEKRGSKNELDILYSIDFAELETTGITITKRLLPFDKRVYIAVAALFNAGNEVITLTQVHYAMGNTTKPASNQLLKIRNSISKMMFAKITVDNTSEAEKYKAYGKFVFNGNLLYAEFIDCYNVQGSFTDAAICIMREPPLITFSKQRGQITTISVKLLQSPLSKTDAHLQIDDYLIERIARIKHKKDHGQGKLLYKTICENANITTAKQRQRLPETVQRYLDHYKECGLITRYTQGEDGVTVYF